MRERAPSKEEIRRRIWDALAESGVARFPLPPHGRIPNFEGAERAAERVRRLRAWERADVVKINPDSPQAPLRRAALEEGKLLLMPTPRLRQGFLLVDPRRVPRWAYRRAATIRGAFQYGEPLPTLEKLAARISHVDFIVEGSVAVNRWGERLGKGEGYGELEYAILLELGLIEPDVEIATTVHDLQVVDERLPQDEFDVPVDWIATPTRLIRVEERPPRPPGVLWDRLPPEKLREIPMLQQLLRRRMRGAGATR